jgi:hypothetical protein
MKNDSMENKDELTPKEKRKEIYKLIHNKNYGETVTFEELNKIIKEDLKDPYGKIRFKSQMSKVKNKLYDDGIVIRSIYNIGYYILKPNQVSSYTYRNFIVKPIKSFDKAKKILEHTNAKGLNADELTELNTTGSLNETLIKTSNRILNSEPYKNIKGEQI